MQSKDSGTHTKAEKAAKAKIGGAEGALKKGTYPPRTQPQTQTLDQVIPSRGPSLQAAIAGRVSFVFVAQFYLNTFPNFCPSSGSHLNRLQPSLSTFIVYLSPCSRLASSSYFPAACNALSANKFSF